MQRPSKMREQVPAGIFMFMGFPISACNRTATTAKMSSYRELTVPTAYFVSLNYLRPASSSFMSLEVSTEIFAITVVDSLDPRLLHYVEVPAIALRPSTYGCLECSEIPSYGMILSIRLLRM